MKQLLLPVVDANREMMEETNEDEASELPSQQPQMPANLGDECKFNKLFI